LQQLLGTITMSEVLPPCYMRVRAVPLLLGFRRSVQSLRPSQQVTSTACVAHLVL
jgi:hypothetical protein